jgi:phosphohistidine phosphatase
VAIVLDILRHGLALPAGPGGDRQRRLSPEGVCRLTALAARLASEGWRPARIFSSPLARAVDSAEVLARATADSPVIETMGALEPDAEPEEVLDALAGCGVTTGHVLLVGHQPLLGRLVGHLAGAETPLSPGMLLRIRCPFGLGRGAGEVVLALPPEEAGRL